MNVGETLLPLGQHFRILSEHPYGPEDQVIKIQRIELILSLNIVFIYSGFILITGIGTSQRKSTLYRDLGRLVVGDIIQQYRIRIIGYFQSQLLIGFLEDCSLVFRIQHREVTRPSHGQDILTQNTHAKGMDRGDPRLSVFFPEHPADPLLHLVGCLIGKRNCQYMTRPDIAVFDQMHDTHRQHPRLSAAGTGNDTQILGPVQHCFLLILI